MWSQYPIMWSHDHKNNGYVPLTDIYIKKRKYVLFNSFALSALSFYSFVQIEPSIMHLL